VVGADVTGAAGDDSSHMVPRAPFHVVVVGGGFAAAEALLALRALAGDRVSLELITPQTALPFRPAATASAFLDEDVALYDLAALASDVGALLRRDVVEAVFPAARRLRLRSGGFAGYDALLLAVGARARAGIPGALTFRDQRDARQVSGVVDGLRSGEVRRLVLSAPAGASWTLPLYELALFSAIELERHDVDAEISIVSPERAPLEAFGEQASTAVGELTARHGIRSITALAEGVDRRGVRLGWGGHVPADAVIAVPSLTGRRLPGIAAQDYSGFVATGDRGRIEDTERVWAAGDMTAFPIKQGGLAAQQAERAAADIAAMAGADVTQPAGRMVLRAKLIGAEPLYLRAELDARGRPLDSRSTTADEPPWWPDAKVFGRYVTPWMAAAAPRREMVTA
jgi:sulfide:quinone oxidoreductase